MNTIALAKELVKIIKSGDMDYASDYFNGWCNGVVWNPFQATEIRRACEGWGVDPERFGASNKQQEQSTERITYEWKDSE